jgi:hypothetical protein
MRWLLLFVSILTLQAKAQQPSCVFALQKVSTDSLLLYVQQITGVIPVTINGTETMIRSRYVTHPGNNIAAEFLKQQLLAYGFLIEDIPFSTSGRNIVAYKPGTVNPKKAYLMGAHYDCVGSATMDFAGADDNASGVAALLETARVLQNDSFPFTLVLAFWDEEEEGLLGSAAFAPDGPIGYWDVLASLNLDMIAYDGNNDSLAMVHTSTIGGSAVLASKMQEVNRVYETQLNIVVKNPGDPSTDHQSFWLKGATAIGLTENYDHDLSPHWHQLSDSISNLKPGYFTKMTKLALATICEITETGNYVSVKEEHPRWLPIYPNPTTDIITLPNSLDWKGATIFVYNSNGEQVSQLLLEQSTFSVRYLPAGLYMLKAHISDGFRYARFIKQ